LTKYLVARVILAYDNPKVKKLVSDLRELLDPNLRDIVSEHAFYWELGEEPSEDQLEEMKNRAKQEIENSDLPEGSRFKGFEVADEKFRGYCSDCSEEFGAPIKADVCPKCESENISLEEAEDD